MPACNVSCSLACLINVNGNVRCTSRGGYKHKQGEAIGWSALQSSSAWLQVAKGYTSESHGKRMGGAAAACSTCRHADPFVSGQIHLLAGPQQGWEDFSWTALSANKVGALRTAAGAQAPTQCASSLMHLQYTLQSSIQGPSHCFSLWGHRAVSATCSLLAQLPTSITPQPRTPPHTHQLLGLLH